MPKQELATIWSHRPYPPYIMSLVTEATVFGLKKIYPRSQIAYGVNYWEKGQNSYLYPAKPYIGTANLIVKNVMRSPASFIKTMRTAYNKAVVLNKYAAGFTPAKIKGADNETLVRWAKEFFKIFLDMYAYGTVPILVGYSQDNFLYQSAEKILKKRTKGSGAFARFYVILTNQPKLGRNTEFDLAIIRLAARARKEGRSDLAAIKSRYRKEIKNIFLKYQWLSFDLCDTTGDKLSIAKLVAEKTGQDLDKQRRDIISYAERTEETFRAAVRELRLTKGEIGIFQAIRHLGYYKWIREYEFMEATFRLKRVQDELARRLKIDALAIKYLLASEYDSLLSETGRYRKELPERIKHCLVVCEAKRGIELSVGKKAEKEWNRIKPKLDSGSGEKTVKGSPAYGGVARGTVRIINSVRHMAKMTNGDILVAVTTNPALLPAMKKAAAIVTNEGGITSHAAIVARELQIPCVVGAKNATNAFQDGQLVEVDAKHGMIRAL